MLSGCPHTKSESLTQIHATIDEIQNFYTGVVFYWCTLYITILPINATTLHHLRLALLYIYIYILWLKAVLGSA